MLSQLKHSSIDKVWKSVLEGSLFEARCGNIDIARKLFKYLISHVPWYGPIYYEAYRMEENEGNDDYALSIIHKGLAELPRYGPLWFGLFRIMERRDCSAEYAHWQRGARPVLRHMAAYTEKAVRLISKELTWKVHFERSQCEERAAEVAAAGMHLHTDHTLKECKDFMLSGARVSLTKSLLTCPNNLRWRVLLVGARLELNVGNVHKARALLHRALTEVPVKSKSYVYLECSRVEEYIGSSVCHFYLISFCLLPSILTYQISIFVIRKSGHRPHSTVPREEGAGGRVEAAPGVRAGRAARWPD